VVFDFLGTADAHDKIPLKTLHAEYHGQRGKSLLILPHHLKERDIFPVYQFWRDVLPRPEQRLLRELQSDSGRSIAELAIETGMSSSATHRKMRSLEENGTIQGYAARLDPRKLGLRMQAFVEITLANQGQEAMDRFEEAARGFEEILSCHLLSGDADYMLRIAAKDLDHFDQIHRQALAKLPGVATMKSSFSIREVKAWAGYPVWSE
jgi:DNA-binding Lrp family transcriptional regulator